MKITKVSPEYYKIVEHFECEGDVTKYLKPYIDDVGVATIGMGSTRYENGTKVKITDPTITKERAISLFYNTLSQYEQGVDDLCPDDFNQFQFDACVDFCYNVGLGAFKSSTLLRLIRSGEKRLEVLEKWFTAWNKGQYKDKKDNNGNGLIDEPGELAPLLGLTRRRKCEALLFCTGKIHYFKDYYDLH